MKNINKKFALYSLLVATVWIAVQPLTSRGPLTLNFHDYATYFALVLSFGGVNVFFYNYLVFIDKVKRGLIDLSSLSSMFPPM